MDVVIIALAGLLIIGIAWSMSTQHDSHDTVSRHENLMRELHRYD